MISRLPVNIHKLMCKKKGKLSHIFIPNLNDMCLIKIQDRNSIQLNSIFNYS